MELILIRGIPGSGKTTLSREIMSRRPSFRHFEADLFFERDGEYRYDRLKIKDAHAWCQAQTRKALMSGKSVIVSNTFVKRFEIEPYLKMAEEFGIKPIILVATGRWQNTHNVPDEVIERMRRSWEPVDGEIRVEDLPPRF